MQPGVWTIGYGHTAGVKKDQIITQSQADAYLISDLEKFENCVNSTGLVLTQNQFDALVSFTYNCGNGNLKTLIRNRTCEEIAEAMLLYNKSNGKKLQGLVRRRKAEYELFTRNMENQDNKNCKENVRKYSKSVDGSKNISKNFKVREFSCKDGADVVLIDELLVSYLQRARNFFAVPVFITSAYRTEAYNRKVNGASNSYHVKGKAADHHTKGKVELFELARFYESVGCLGIIVYPNSGFIHIDTRDDKYFAIDTGNKITKKTSFV